MLAEGMRLFGEQGYASTSVAQIERAAGLSPGSGSLYKHFASKEALLTEGLRQLLAGGQQLTDELQQEPVFDPSSLPELLAGVTRAGLRRMDEDRDLSRIVFRGLDAFPELLTRFGEEEIARFNRAVAVMLADLADDTEHTTGHTTDWSAVAVVLQGATAHYWVLADLFGQHPTGVSEDRFVAAMSAVAAGFLTSVNEPIDEDGRPRREKGDRR